MPRRWRPRFRTRVQVIEGQQHVADILEPAKFVEQLLRFLRVPT
jgi:hypothetical protein